MKQKLLGLICLSPIIGMIGYAIYTVPMTLIAFPISGFTILGVYLLTDGYTK